MQIVDCRRYYLEKKVAALANTNDYGEDGVTDDGWELGSLADPFVLELPLFAIFISFIFTILIRMKTKKTTTTKMKKRKNDELEFIRINLAIDFTIATTVTRVLIEDLSDGVAIIVIDVVSLGLEQNCNFLSSRWNHLLFHENEDA